MRFNGPLVSRVSSIKLMDSRGGEIAATLQPSSNNTEIVAKPERPLSSGTYRATWTAAGENDGHRMSGNISFTVK
jgi:methionine-rich copper-binding protein CopC